MSLSLLLIYEFDIIQENMEKTGNEVGIVLDYLFWETKYKYEIRHTNIQQIMR